MNDLVFSTGMIILVNILAWITPGPNMFAVIAASLEHGRRQGLATGLGLACGTFFWATFSVLGATILFDLFPTAVLALKLIGASYLIWLGFKSVKSSMKQNSIMDLEVMTRTSLGKSVVKGFLISITNPKAALFFGSVMTVLIPNAAPDWYLGLVIFICVLLAIVCHSITATLFSTTLAVTIFSKAKRLVSLLFGAAFISLGGSIVYATLFRSR